MASPNLYSNGIGGTTGAALVSKKPLSATGGILYLDSATGSDSYDGLDRNTPKATLSGALSAMSSGDILSVLAGHAESITVAIACALNDISILGEGSGSTMPAFTRAADIDMITFSGTNVHIEGCKFPESTVACSSSGKIVASSTSFSAVACHFDAGANDLDCQLSMSGGSAATAVVTGCAFTSVATDPAAQPTKGLSVGSDYERIDLDTLIFDGGTVGWSSYALDLVGTSSVIGLRAVNIDLLNGSDAGISSSASGYIHVRNKSGSARVVSA